MTHHHKLPTEIPCPKAHLYTVGSCTACERDEAHEDLCKAIQLIQRLKRGKCWCEAGVDNPMMNGKHSATCLEVKRFMGE